MRVVRFTWYIISPFLAPLLLIPLGIAYIILAPIVWIWSCWDRAGKSS